MAFAVEQDVLWLAIPEHFIIVHVLQNNLIPCDPNISYDHGTIEVINNVNTGVLRESLFDLYTMPSL